ncbi:MAG: aminoacyl-histidine dipeptidase [Bacteroidales bacterium]|nr:aminoacyl-histidine dipeptidase [Bacteroidales bacterium]
MNSELLKLQPERVWYYFTEILKIPRPSKKEEKIIAYLKEFGAKHKLETIQDETGNILMRKPASPGMENRKSVVLQSHIDMVCEKNNDVEFDFNKDAIQARIEGEWVKATGTTLGADDGIGVATQLAILEADDIQHGPIECLFTVDEETGLTGAFGLKPGFLKSSILLNLDSEDEGELFIGCAGGKDTVIEMPYQTEAIPQGYTSCKIEVKGLVGGHSGDDIQKGRANANKLLNRMLYMGQEDFGLRLSEFNGGNLRNAIAREAFAVILVPDSRVSDFVKYVKGFHNTARSEYHVTEPNLEITIDEIRQPEKVVDLQTQTKLIHSLYACPHGVIAWSADIPNFVETSTNLASVKIHPEHILITTSQRSSVESAKEDICNMVASVFRLTGAKVYHTDGYPGWTPNPHSEIVEISEKLYKALFNQDPKVLAIHAGLECGLIGDVYPEMDMISYGPTIKGAHSPDERLLIVTVKKFWDLTLEILKNIPAGN